jgi:prolyl-tRNA synthetase
VQVVIVPIVKKDDEREAVLSAARDLHAAAELDGLRVRLDADEGRTPGWKFHFWEMKVGRSVCWCQHSWGMRHQECACSWRNWLGRSQQPCSQQTHEQKREAAHYCHNTKYLNHVGLSTSLQGVPVRVEVGPRDVASGSCVVSRRDRPGKEGKTFGVPFEPAAFVQHVSDLLDDVQV